MKLIKILALIEDERDGSGPTIVTLRLFKEMSDKGLAKIHVVTPESKTIITALEKTNLKYTVCPYPFTEAREVLFQGKAARSALIKKRALISSLISAFGPDIIHCSMHQSSLVMKDLVETTPVFVQFHANHKYPSITPYSFYYKNLFKRKNFHGLTVSDWIRRNVLSMGVVPAKVSTLYNGIDLSEMLCYSKMAVKESIKTKGFDDKNFVIGMAAQIRKEKGIHHFIKSVSEFSSRNKSTDVVGVIVGRSFDQNYEIFCKDLASKAKSNNMRFVFTGFYPDPFEIMSRFDISLIPSLFDDPLPTVAVESIALGLPTIAYRRGGLPEILGEKAGTLVDPNSIKGLVNAIESEYLNIKNGKSVNDIGILRSKNMFSVQAMAKSYQKLSTNLMREDNDELH